MAATQAAGSNEGMAAGQAAAEKLRSDGSSSGSGQRKKRWEQLRQQPATRG